MRKLSDIYIKLQECFIIFSSSNLCVEIQYLVNSKKITKEEYNLLCTDFATFKPEGKQKGEYWFNSREERIEFLKNRISNLKENNL